MARLVIFPSALLLIAALRPPVPAGDAPEGGAAVRIEAERAVIENAFLSIEVSLADQRIHTKSITNRITEEVTALDGEDFVLLLEGAKRFKAGEFLLEKAVEEPAGGGGKRLALQLSRDDLKVRLLIEMGARDPWALRWLEITGGSGRLDTVSLSEWRTLGAWGQPGTGKKVDALGYPEGCGQPAYVSDLYFAIEHPGAENFARGKRIACRIPAYDELGPGKTVVTKRFVLGAAEAGGALPAFLRFLDTRRANPARMVIVANDWYWKDKSRTAEAVAALAAVKAATGIPIDSFTLDDGWDLRDGSAPLWTKFDPSRFPGGWDSIAAAARPAGLGVSLWFGPIGGYGGREVRVEIGRKAGFEVNGDKLCLSGAKYRAGAIEALASWAAKGMDYLKVDGFWPDCGVAGHGHPVGRTGAIAQMDALIEFFAALRKARPGLPIAYTSGSNPSPFWLEHCDFVWRGGADDEHAGEGDPFDRHATYIDSCLQVHRPTDMPVSTFATFEIVQPRLAGTSDASFERNAWWLMARTSLHHDWYVQASDLTTERWKVLDRAARWGKSHEKLFRLGRMVAGDPRQGAVYGFSAFEAGAGVLAFRNPSSKPGAAERTLSNLLGLPIAARKGNYRFVPVYGETKALEGVHGGRETINVELPPLAVAIFEVKLEK